MSEIERALRSAFALDPAASPGPGFEARMVRAARARGRRTRAAPALLAAAVAGAVVATLAIGRGDRPAPAPRIAVQPAHRHPAGPSRSVTAMWELVIRLGRTLSVYRDDDERGRDAPDRDDDQADHDRFAPEPAPRDRRDTASAAEPSIDCGDDPLCPLVAPHAGRLRIATSGTSARVSIDGQDAGATPLDIELIPGRHRISFRFADGRRRVEEVVLRPGERRTLLVSPPAAARPPTPK